MSEQLILISEVAVWHFAVVAIILFFCRLFTQYPMDKTKGLKVPVQIRVNMWLGLSAHEKKFNSFSEGTFSVFAELVYHLSQQKQKIFSILTECKGTFESYLEPRSQINISKTNHAILLHYSMRTRPRCLASGGPQDWWDVTNSRM